MGERFSAMGMQRNVRHWTYSTVLKSLMPGDVRDQNTERLEVISKPNSDVNVNNPRGITFANNYPLFKKGGYGGIS
jgi:hypothetical protein